MRVFEIAAGIIAFCALYFTLISALPLNAMRYVAVLMGAAVAAIFLIFTKNKLAVGILIGVMSLYTVLAATASIPTFKIGAQSFWNGIADAINSNVHRGLPYAQVSAGAGEDFLFSSVISVWLALGVAFLSVKLRAAVIIGDAAAVFILMFLGLYPSIFAAVALAISVIGLLVVGNGYTLKAAAGLAVCAAVIAAAIAPCAVYVGSDGVREFRQAIFDSVEKTTYGNDSLPEGRLQNAGGMNASDTVRLEVTVPSQTPTLYLKGFVGSEFSGNMWQPTDKNVYVQNGWQGISDWFEEEGFPSLQYSRYLELGGNSNRYSVSVENIGAKRKYVYAPYAVLSHSAGSPYFDLNLRGKNRKYSYIIAGGDASGERVTQASWLLSGDNRTAAMDAYLSKEGEYRAFAYDAYSSVDGKTAQIIVDRIGESEATSINTVTQLMRAYFLDAYTYSETPDKIDGDFMSDFFGGKIINANSAYFATAATHIFRLYGFAARYAEGYLVRTDDGADDSEHAIAVTDKDAHAWAEVYFDGIGWLPIEVTPTFFSEENPNVNVDPDNPDNPNEYAPPVEPTAPPEDPDEPNNPDPPAPPPIKEDEPPTADKYAKLRLALKALLPIVSAALFTVLILLGFILHRELKLRGKRRKLDCNGEAFGRAAYSVLEHDCRSYGGFNAETLAKCSIAPSATERFMQLIEQCVYGGYELNLNERLYVLTYLENVSAALAISGSKADAFIAKYIRCLGI